MLTLAAKGASTATGRLTSLDGRVLRGFERVARRRHADRDVLGQHLGNLGVEILVRQVPRLDLVLLVVTECLEDRTPALRTE